MKAKDSENGPRKVKAFRLDEKVISDLKKLSKKLEKAESEVVEYAVRELKRIWL